MYNLNKLDRVIKMDEEQKEYDEHKKLHPQNPFDELRREQAIQMQAIVSGILADFENLLVDVMGARKCSIGSLENYYDLHLEVKRINELYSKLQEYFTVSQNSR